MLLLSEISDAVALALISAAMLIIKDFLDAKRLREKEAADHRRASEAASKVEEVKTTLAEAKDTHDAKLSKIAEDIHTVELATNSMKDALIVTTEREAHARGLVESRAEQDAKLNKIVEDIHMVELATNSVKDALIVAAVVPDKSAEATKEKT